MATASSPRKKCKPSQTRSKKSGRCIKKPCSPGKTRDVLSRRCRKKKCGSGKTRDVFSRLCRKKKSRSPKRSSRKSPKRSSRKSPKRKSPKRKSPKRKSPKRKSPTTKSRSRKQPCNKPGQTRSRKSNRCRVPPCKDGMIRNKKSGNCRKKCLPGQYRSRSGRCKLIGSSSAKRKSPSTKSRSTKSLSTKSRSRKSPCKKPGQTRSRKTNRCRVPPCKDGMIRNKKSGNCRKKCLPGQYRSRSGRCKLIGSGSGSGTSLGSSSSSSSSAFGFKSGASSTKTAIDDGLTRLGVAMPDPMKLFSDRGIIPPGMHGFVPKAADGRKLHSSDSAHLATVKSKHKDKHFATDVSLALKKHDAYRAKHDPYYPGYTGKDTTPPKKSSTGVFEPYYTAKDTTQLKKSSTGVLNAVRKHDDDRMINDPSHPIGRLSSDQDAYPVAYPLVYPLAYPVADDSNSRKLSMSTPSIVKDLNEYDKWKAEPKKN